MQPASPLLAELNDVVVPHTAPLWPLAPAWYLVIAFTLSLVGIVVFMALRAWQKRAVKRHAIKALSKCTTAEAKWLLVKNVYRHYFGTHAVNVSNTQFAELLKRQAGVTLNEDELNSLYQSPSNNTHLGPKLAKAITALRVPRREHV